MATFYGADVEQLDRLAVALESEGRALETLLRRLDARMKAVHWQGPDAERSRNEWSTAIFPRCLVAAEGLTSTAQVVRSNAAAQRDASGAAGSMGSGTGTAHPYSPPFASLPTGPLSVPRGLFEPGVLTPSDLFRPTREALDARIPGTLWSWGDVGGLVPGASTVLSVRDMADEFSQGKLPIHGMVDTAAGELRKVPHAYLAGVALGTWNTTVEEFGKADFSQQTIATTNDYIANDPWGAVSAASEAVVSFLPNLVKNFL